MTLQEKFDTVINCIERFVGDLEHDIPQAVARETGYNLRLLGDAFQFVTDITLAKYIRQRRLVYALTNRLAFNLPVEQLASDAGFSDAAAFSKACKNEFGFPPTQITEDILKKYTPLSFDRVVSGKDGEQLENDTLATAKKRDSICGVSAEQFAEIKQVLELGAIYGLSDEEAEFIYRLSLYCEVTTAQAAEFYDDFKLQIENGSVLPGLSLYDMAELACRYDLSFSQAQEIMYMLSCHGYDSIHTLPDSFFDVYFCEVNDRFGWSVPYICDIAEALENHGMSASDLEEIVSNGDTFDVDVIEAIERFQEFEDTWDDLLDDAMRNGIPEDDTQGFGYRSIWELSDDEYQP